MLAPRSSHSVLSFWFGCIIADAEGRAGLSTAAVISQLVPLWYMGGEAMDVGCRAFSDVIRELKSDGLEEWASTEGKLARMLLADQISRNAFRGTPEAFGYDDLALRLSQALVSPAESADTMALPAALLSFVGLPLQHSELLADHDAGVALNAKQQAAYPGLPFFQQSSGFVTSHRDVVVRFGRYPHRNAQCGRETTPEEQAWLDDTENRPPWSKST